jgi:hypothetical protein
VLPQGHRAEFLRAVRRQHVLHSVVLACMRMESLVSSA